MYIPPEHPRTFGGGADDTTLVPAVAVALVVALILILALPRKYMVWPVSFMLFLVPSTQQVLIGGVHLFAFRIIVLVGAMKMLLAKASSPTTAPSGRFSAVDRVFLCYSICSACASIVLFASTDALVNQVGFLWDYIGGYFLFRYLIQDEEDIFRVIRCFAVVAMVVAACMLVERATLHNIFGQIGGDVSPEIRNGRVRCDGPFRHALTAGAFGATLMPLFLLGWKSGRGKALAVIGLVSSILITWNSNSSTSLFAFQAGLLALAFWPLRQRMRVVRWVIASALIGLQIVMKAPVWFLIARVDLTGGSQSYHRAELVDQFVRHFWDWWLIGIKSTGLWGLGMWDTQNQFVLVGETGGLLAFILFIAVISRSFASLGNARKVVQGQAEKEWFLWILGAALFSHLVAFFGVNYFDQSKFAWFAALAMVAAATAPILEPALLGQRQASASLKISRSPQVLPSPAPVVAGKASRPTNPPPAKSPAATPAAAVPDRRSRPTRAFQRLGDV